MRQFLFYFAATGWVIGLIVHLTAAMGDYDLTQTIPFLWLLHVGIFVVWVPTILKLKNNPEIKNKTFINPRVFLRVLFKESPTWLIIIAAIGFFYAGFNFSLFMVSQPGVPDVMQGQYVLQNHGQIVKTLTETEYYHALANQTRGFSGHWLAFYGIATAVLYPFNRHKQVIE
jgi:hypothetical protein